MKEMRRISSWKTIALIFAIAASPFLSFAAGLFGKVISENGEPLPFATIQVEGTEKGALTNAEGVFYLNDLEKENVTLSINYPGFGKKVVADLETVEGSESEGVLIQLDENISEMDDYTINVGEVDPGLITLDPVLIYAESSTEDKVDFKKVSFNGVPLTIWVWKLFTWLKGLF